MVTHNEYNPQTIDRIHLLTGYLPAQEFIAGVENQKGYPVGEAICISQHNIISVN